jgi:hypothetical protein
MFRNTKFNPPSGGVYQAQNANWRQGALNRVRGHSNASLYSYPVTYTNRTKVDYVKKVIDIKKGDLKYPNEYMPLAKRSVSGVKKATAYPKGYQPSSNIVVDTPVSQSARDRREQNQVFTVMSRTVTKDPDVIQVLQALIQTSETGEERRKWSELLSKALSNYQRHRERIEEAIENLPKGRLQGALSMARLNPRNSSVTKVNPDGKTDYETLLDKIQKVEPSKTRQEHEKELKKAIKQIMDSGKTQDEAVTALLTLITLEEPRPQPMPTPTTSGFPTPVSSRRPSTIVPEGKHDEPTMTELKEQVRQDLRETGQYTEDQIEEIVSQITGMPQELPQDVREAILGEREREWRELERRQRELMREQEPIIEDIPQEELKSLSEEVRKARTIAERRKKINELIQMAQEYKERTGELPKEVEDMIFEILRSEGVEVPTEEKEREEKELDIPFRVTTKDLRKLADEIKYDPSLDTQAKREAYFDQLIEFYVPVMLEYARDQNIKIEDMTLRDARDAVEVIGIPEILDPENPTPEQMQFIRDSLILLKAYVTGQMGIIGKPIKQKPVKKQKKIKQTGEGKKKRGRPRKVKKGRDVKKEMSEISKLLASI